MNSNDTDETLMQFYQEGHASAFDLLFARHRQKVWAFLLKRLSPRENAEEVFQLTWVKLHASRFRYESSYPFLPWLFMIARQTLIDWVRQQKKYKSDVHSDDVLLSLIAEETQKDIPSIEGLLNQMNPDERKLYEEHFENELTFDEISKKMSLPSATLRKRMSRMLIRLKKSNPGELP